MYRAVHCEMAYDWRSVSGGLVLRICPPHFLAKGMDLKALEWMLMACGHPPLSVEQYDAYFIDTAT